MYERQILWVSINVYCSFIRATEAVCISETSVISSRQHSATSQKITAFIIRTFLEVPGSDFGSEMTVVTETVHGFTQSIEADNCMS
jgi:hypothetical protein